MGLSRAACVFVCGMSVLDDVSCHFNSVMPFKKNGNAISTCLSVKNNQNQINQINVLFALFNVFLQQYYYAGCPEGHTVSKNGSISFFYAGCPEDAL